MKKLLIIVLTALTFVGFVGCKKNVASENAESADANKAAPNACAEIKLSSPATSEEISNVLAAFFKKFDAIAKDAVKEDGTPDCDKFGDALLAHLRECNDNLKSAFQYLEELDGGSPELKKMQDRLKEDLAPSEAYLKTQETCAENDKVMAFASDLLEIMLGKEGKAAALKNAAAKADAAKDAAAAPADAAAAPADAAAAPADAK